jgi:hypothetical protein
MSPAKYSARVLLAAAILVTSVLAAEPAYVGAWKINAGKSSLTGDTVAIGTAAGGMMQFSSQGFTYTFKLDGKDYPMPSGGTTAWSQTSATIWDVANRLNGKVISTYHLVLSGDTLAVNGLTIKPDGGKIEFSSSYKRVSGGPGFAGTWMSTTVKLPVTLLEIALSGANGVALKDDTGPVVTGQFDGRDNAAQGMMAGTNSTYSLRKISASSFELTSKLNGKPMYIDVYSVSADGKILTINGTPVNAKTETYKLVFDRQ